MAFGGLTLRDLEYVTAVAEFGSFTVAAEHCAVSQPSLSTQVRKVGSNSASGSSSAPDAVSASPGSARWSWHRRAACWVRRGA
jgi:hypothetical protein